MRAYLVRTVFGTVCVGHDLRPPPPPLFPSFSLFLDEPDFAQMAHIEMSLPAPEQLVRTSCPRINVDGILRAWGRNTEEGAEMPKP